MPPPKDNRSPSKNYRKPPVEHRFKKGTSGNPNGRPKKAKDIQPGLGASAGGIADRLGAMAMDEATRPIMVREGDKVSKIPAMQAILRTMFRSAAQGDTKVGRQLLELFTRVESARTDTVWERLEYAVQYKETYAPIFEQHERDGLDPPDIYPHPDDVIINGATGEVTLGGPATKDQAGAWKAFREKAIEALGRYFDVDAALKKDPTNRELKQEFKELKKYFDFLERDRDRKARHEALRLSRRTLRPKPPEPEDDSSDQA